MSNQAFVALFYVIIITENIFISDNLGVYSYATPESLHTAIGTERTYKVARTFIPTVSPNI